MERVFTYNFCKILWTWVFVVEIVITSFSAICGFVSPSTIKAKTSISRSVKPYKFLPNL